MKYLYLILSVIFHINIYAQDNLMDLLEKETSNEIIKVSNHFFSNKTIFNNTSEILSKKNLQIKILHRFSSINSGKEQSFGFNNALTSLYLNYGVSKKLNFGCIYNISEKKIALNTNYLIITQSKGGKVFPFSIAYYASIETKSNKWENDSINNHFSSRISYFNQIIFSRKVFSKFSFLFAPTYIHNNIVKLKNDKNDIFAISFSANYLILSRLAIIGDFVIASQSNSQLSQKANTAFALGLEVQAGKHVFNISLSNYFTNLDSKFFNTDFGKINKGEVNLGFSIIKTF